METYLVDGGDDLGVGQDLLLEDLLGAVGHTDGADLALLEDGFQLLPGVAERPVVDHITVAVRAGREGRVVAVRVQVDGPVDQIHWDVSFSILR